MRLMRLMSLMKRIKQEALIDSIDSPILALPLSKEEMEKLAEYFSFIVR